MSAPRKRPVAVWATYEGLSHRISSNKARLRDDGIAIAESAKGSKPRKIKFRLKPSFLLQRAALATAPGHNSQEKAGASTAHHQHHVTPSAPDAAFAHRSASISNIRRRRPRWTAQSSHRPSYMVPNRPSSARRNRSPTSPPLWSRLRLKPQTPPQHGTASRPGPAAQHHGQPSSPAASDGSGSAAGFFRSFVDGMGPGGASTSVRSGGALTPDLVFAEIGHGRGATRDTTTTTAAPGAWVLEPIGRTASQGIVTPPTIPARAGLRVRRPVDADAGGGCGCGTRPVRRGGVGNSDHDADGEDDGAWAARPDGCARGEGAA
ncbi:hypothetical protein EVG20_g536 [Dentipellis fragilis]|uniref:Uncharacterized protein n=1 Tax=Dentipellis fragilis TaxID=205917 RepID=A0A4Y9ZG74_9AGAM|nr:hypothetical protein EVG20_g536 [Dentipellis fragilis]